MLTSRLLGVPSALFALASLAPLTLAHDVQLDADAAADAQVRGSGSGVIFLPETEPGEMRGTLYDAFGKPAYLMRARLETFDVFFPGLRVGTLDGRLYDPLDSRLVGTMYGAWDYEQNLGRFQAQVHPVGVPDPHHFVVGFVQGTFELKGAGGAMQAEINAQKPAPPQGATALRPVLRPASSSHGAAVREPGDPDTPRIGTDPYYGPASVARQRDADGGKPKSLAQPVAAIERRTADGGRGKAVSLPVAAIERRTADGGRGKAVSLPVAAIERRTADGSRGKAVSLPIAAIERRTADGSRGKAVSLPIAAIERRTADGSRGKAVSLPVAAIERRTADGSRGKAVSLPVAAVERRTADGSRGKAMSLPFSLLPRFAAQMANVRPAGAVGYFEADWQIDPLR